MSKSEVKIYSSEELKSRICGKYPSPAWVVLHELRDGTGFVSSGREADAVAFGTWPSRGFSIIGFEVKSHRGDWLQELRKPEKAESIASYCDEWFIVGSKDIIKLEEVPKTWGWLAPKGGGLTVMKPAKEMAPCPIDRVFLASIVRNVEKNYTPNSMVKLAAENQAKNIANNLAWEAKQNLENYDKLQAVIKEFQEASGVNLERPWSCSVKDVGTVVKAIMDSDLNREIFAAKRALKQAAETLKSLEAIQIAKSPKEEEI